jgi:glycosyltransferase involved in cell wall biosynthesis
VVCSYNRAVLLNGCLQSIFNQTVDQNYYEIIVVDNNSNDNTREVVESFKDHFNLRYFLETRQGLSYARNLGLEKARGEYVAYLDDDVLVPPNWLKILMNLIDKNVPYLDGLGGPLYPFYTTPKPDWYEDNYAVQMGSRKIAGFLDSGKSFIGANMIWKKDLLKSIDGFSPEFGYVGNIQTLGEETDAYYRAWKFKPSAMLLFSPELQVKHWVPPEKMTLSFRINRYFKQGLTNYYINEPYLVKDKPALFFKKSFSLIKVFLRSIFKVTKYDHWQKWVFCEFAPIASVWGEICGMLGKKIPKGESKT